MPLSKRRNRDRMRVARHSRAHLLPKAEARRLRVLGVALEGHTPTAEDYSGLRRAYDAKAARVDWQSTGIARLHTQVAQLEERAIQQEADLARLEVMIDSMLAEEWLVHPSK